MDDGGCESDYDITGMWEEPVKTQGNPGRSMAEYAQSCRPMRAMTTTAEVIGKQCDGSI